MKKMATKSAPQPIQTIEINGRAFALPPQEFFFGSKRVFFYPHDLVFQVYDRNQFSVGATARLDVALGWMRKRGRRAGHVLSVVIDHHPHGAFGHVARIVAAEFGRRGVKDMRIEYAGKVYDASEVSADKQ